jgi:hypothetical protein
MLPFQCEIFAKSFRSHGLKIQKAQKEKPGFLRIRVVPHESDETG